MNRKNLFLATLKFDRLCESFHSGIPDIGLLKFWALRLKQKITVILCFVGTDSC